MWMIAAIAHHALSMEQLTHVEGSGSLPGAFGAHVLEIQHEHGSKKGKRSAKRRSTCAAQHKQDEQAIIRRCWQAVHGDVGRVDEQHCQEREPDRPEKCGQRDESEAARAVGRWVHEM